MIRLLFWMLLLATVFPSIALAQLDGCDDGYNLLHGDCKEVVCRMPVDLVFLLDGSESIGEQNFEIVKSFVQNTTSDFLIGPNSTRVSVVEYTTWSREKFRLNQYTTWDDLLPAIQNIYAQNRGTKTGLAITYEVYNSLSESHGARPGVPKVMIVVTDGHSADDVTEPAQRAKRKGVIMVAIAVGPDYNMDELRKIATSEDTLGTVTNFTLLKENMAPTICHKNPYLDLCQQQDRGGCEQNCYNFHGSYYCTCNAGYALAEDNHSCEDLDECEFGNGGCGQYCTNTVGSYHCSCDDGYNLLHGYTCIEVVCRTPVDLVFLLDGSDSIGELNFDISKSFVQNTTSRFLIGPNNTRVSVVPYNSWPWEQFRLNRYTTWDDLFPAIQNIYYRNGGIHTGRAITYVLDNSLTESRGARPGVPKVVIVVTDGHSTDDVTQPAQRAKREGVIMVAIGVGSGYNIDELRKIATSEDTLGTVADFTLLKEDMAPTICHKNPYVHVCQQPDRGGCEENCYNFHGSYYCTCNEGYALAEDNHSCKDLDRCSILPCQGKRIEAPLPEDRNNVILNFRDYIDASDAKLMEIKPVVSSITSKAVSYPITKYEVSTNHALTGKWYLFQPVRIEACNSTCDVSVIIKDDTAPRVNCPSASQSLRGDSCRDIRLYDYYNSSTIESWFRDNVGIKAVHCTQTGFRQIEIGETATAICYATDIVGNPSVGCDVTFHCKPYDCPPLTPPEFGAFVCHEDHLVKRCALFCQEGKFHKRRNIFECDMTNPAGTWTGARVHNDVICRDRGKHKPQYTYNTSCDPDDSNFLQEVKRTLSDTRNNHHLCEHISDNDCEVTVTCRHDLSQVTATLSTTTTQPTADQNTASLTFSTTTFEDANNNHTTEMNPSHQLTTTGLSPTTTTTLTPSISTSMVSPQTTTATGTNLTPQPSATNISKRPATTAGTATIYTSPNTNLRSTKAANTNPVTTANPFLHPTSSPMFSPETTTTAGTNHASITFKPPVTITAGTVTTTTSSNTLHSTKNVVATLITSSISKPSFTTSAAKPQSTTTTATVTRASLPFPATSTNTDEPSSLSLLSNSPTKAKPIFASATSPTSIATLNTMHTLPPQTSVMPYGSVSASSTSTSRHREGRPRMGSHFPLAPVIAVPSVLCVIALVVAAIFWLKKKKKIRVPVADVYSAQFSPADNHETPVPCDDSLACSKVKDGPLMKPLIR